MSIEIRDVSKTFGSFQALSDVNLTVGTGELVALLGPSGSGKTTLLRIIAGLEFATQGSILFDGDGCLASGRPLAAGRLCLPALRAVPAHEHL